jgi:hypothetical protein
MLQDDRPTALPRLPSGPPAFRDAPLGPRAVFILDLFRLLAQFRAGYDARVLARAEALAVARLGEAADEAMAAAVQIDNEFRCRTPLPYADGRLGSRVATRREVAFLRMLEALESGSPGVARRAAETLDVSETHELFGAGRRLSDALQALQDEPERVRRPLPPWRDRRADATSASYG